MADGAGSWSLIESDPGVFTELIKSFGATGVQVEEIWSLEDDSIEEFKPVHGLIFLFKWIQDDEPSGTVITDAAVLDNVFFAKQVINNACASQAIINILMNCKHSDLDLGKDLKELREFCQSFDSQMRGLALGNSQTIRSAHNSFARQTLFEIDSKSGAKDDEVYHFIGYMPIDGRIYELDGMKDGPIDLGAVPPNKDWIEAIIPIVQKRVKKYSEGEIHFNLMAVVSDKKRNYERKLNKILEEKMDTEETQAEIRQIRMMIDYEEEKFKKYQVEIARRRHNYLPFIIEMLKVLAKDGKLVPLYEDAKRKAAEKQTSTSAVST